MKDITKTVADSFSGSSKLLFPKHMNNEGILYGGQHLMWLDELAGIVAKRHCGNEKQRVTTACIESVDFYKPCYQSDIIDMQGFITYVGNSSMEICIETYTGGFCDNKTLVNRAYLVLVALDDNGHPVTVPRLNPASIQEKERYEAGKQRSIIRKNERMFVLEQGDK